MKNSTTFDNTVATAVENAVMEVYGSKRHEIYQFIDSEAKKVVVFILFHHFGYDKFSIGRNYQMTYLYVPTVADELEFWYKKDVSLKEKIDLVMSKVQSLKMAV